MQAGSSSRGVCSSRLLCLCLCFVTWSLASPVHAEPVTDFQTWTQLQTAVNLDALKKGLSATLESTVRRGSPALINALTGAQDEAPLTYVFVRPSVGYDVLPWLNLTLGYAWAPVFYDAAAERPSHQINEHRVWEQLTFSHTLKQLGLGLASRTRLEERMRTRGPGAGECEVRLRQRFRGAYTLLNDLPFQAVVTDEVMFFLNNTDFSSEPGFSENRAFAGLGYRVPGIVVEVGYLNQFVGGHAHPHRSNHVLSTSITFQFSMPDFDP